MTSLVSLLEADARQLTPIALRQQIDPSSPNVRNEIIQKLAEQKKLKDDYTFTFPKEPISLSEVICNRLRYEKILLKLRKDSCSLIAGKLAKNLIRVGATRIFSDPERSFLEPIVNSLDAYKYLRGQRPTGKFGIGFYSLLYWLTFSGGELVIESRPIAPTDSLAFTPYRATINSNFDLKIEPLEQTNEDFRFRLTLNLSGEARQKISDDDVIVKLKDDFDFVKSSQIILVIDNEDEDIDLKEINPTVKDIVNVTFKGSENNVFFQVSDKGTGLPLYSLGNLLVPSLSTKTISASNVVYAPQIGSETRFSENSPIERLIILVGEIVLFNVYTKRDVPGVIIQLSSNSSLPVSRDDILLSNRLTKEEFEMNVFYLLDEGLEKNPKIYPQALITSLENYPTGRYLIPVIRERIFARGYIFVPQKYFELYRQITKRKIVGVNDTLSLATEDLLLKEKEADTDIFVGKSVYFVKTDTLNFADATRIIFLNQKFRTISDYQKASWNLKFKEFSLLPTGSEWKSQDKLKKKIQEAVVGSQDPTALSNLFGRFLGLSTIFDQRSVDFCFNLLERFFESNRHLSLTQFHQLIAGYFRLFSQFKPNIAYGSSMKTLYYTPIDEQTISDNEKEFNLYIEFFDLLIPMAVEEDVLVFIPSFISWFRKDVFYRIVEVSSNFIELAYLHYLFLSEIIIPIEHVDLLLDFWRTYLRNDERTEIILKYFLFPKYLMGASIYPQDLRAFTKLIVTPSEIYVELIEQKKDLLKKIGPVLALPRNYGSFYYLSRLLEAIFNDENLENIPDERGTLPIQILEIAINEGTTKGFIPAMITETFQNSVDAVRMTGSTNPIRIDLGRTGQTLSYSISDTVGIPPEGIIALSIPFLSSKTGKGATGEIGSGFFNVYRRAVLVNIDTVFKGKRTLINDQPVLESGRIVDVERQISTKEISKENGTTITVYFQSTEPEKELTEMITYCRNVLPLAQSFVLNGEKISIPSEKVREFDGKGLVSLRTSTVPFESYLLTRGVPFAPFLETNLGSLFPDWARSLISVGYIFDLLDGFSPTQSRTSIRIEDERIKSLVTDAFYCSMLQLQLAEKNQNYVQNFTSRANINQIRPSASPKEIQSLSDFLWYHIPGVDATFYQIKDSKINDKNVSLAFGVTAYSFEGKVRGNPLQQEVLIAWIKNKDRSVMKKAVDLQAKKGNVEAFSEEALNFANKFVKAFCEKTGRGSNVPVVRIAIMEGRLGEYDPLENVIRLSNALRLSVPPKKLTPDNILGYIDQNVNMYGKTFPASTIIHELEHHRRHGAHSPDSHGEVTIDGKRMTFDQSANYFYDLALTNGLVGEILK